MAVPVMARGGRLGGGALRFTRSTVLATLHMPDQYHEWNRRWLAPQGLDGRTYLPTSTRMSRRRARALGPFVWQPNSSTRSFEYPWAFSCGEVRPGQRLLEIGGALSGFQFVLARTGASVVNVDPLVPYGNEDSYGADPAAFHAWLNGLYGTDVVLVATTLDEAALAPASFDTVFCISTIEHLRAEDVATVLREAARVLKPDGRFVLTVDLFLNLVPFTRRTRNDWGENVSVRGLVDASGLELDTGERGELFGFPEFDPEHVLSNLERYAIGVGYPQLAQAFSLRKPAGL